MQYTIQQISDIVNGRLSGFGDREGMIYHLLLDSRQIVFPGSSLFIALQGRRFDGHAFIEELYENGVRCFLVSEQPDTERFPEALFVRVEDTQVAFHKLAGWHRHRFSLPVTAITGSNGKTIVKEWLFHLLHEDQHIVRSPKSYNSQTGVPLSLLQINPEHTMGIFEAGISQMGEMEKLAPLIDPDTGIFTNIGEAHSEGFPDTDTKIREKLRLFEKTRLVIYCVDDERVDRIFRTDKRPGRQYFTWSLTGKKADLIVTRVVQDGSHTHINAKWEGTPRSMQITIPFTDHASIENAIHCWVRMLTLGYDLPTIARRMEGLEPVAMRLELKEGNNGCIVINDSYNSDLTSLSIALNFLVQQSKTTGHTLILSDILQSGKSPEKLYRSVAQLIQEKNIDRLIGIGEDVQILDQLLPAGFSKEFFTDTATFLDKLDQVVFQDETILLKGARHFSFEKIANRLAGKVHQTILEVNLTALLHNLRVYQGHLQAGTRLMVMVKAGAYGSGPLEVAKLLEFHQVDYLGVAYADEGVELRNAGIQLPIIVLNPEEVTFDALLRYGLEPEIYSHSLLEKYLRFARSFPREQVTHAITFEKNGRFPVHLKLDTGMHRLGFQPEDLPGLIELLIKDPSPAVYVKTVFSHLAGSETPVHDDFTRHQITSFQQMYEQICTGLGYRPMRHILNSGGIVRFPEYQMEMVRLGIGLYGIDESEVIQKRLQTVNTLKATISQVKHIRAGETIGYGRSGKAVRPMRMATISIGYADGLLRKAGNGSYRVMINGQMAPLIGNVCMDMAMVDITQLPDARAGDEVIIFGKDPHGKQLPVQVLAKCLDTIPYEVFTSISPRVKRVYIQE